MPAKFLTYNTPGEPSPSLLAVVSSFHSSFPPKCDPKLHPYLLVLDLPSLYSTPPHWAHPPFKMEGVLIVLHPSPPIPSFRASSHTLTHPFPLSHFPNSTLTFLNFLGRCTSPQSQRPPAQRTPPSCSWWSTCPFAGSQWGRW